jgi:DNA-binding transcriptional LysR family regulator
MWESLRLPSAYTKALSIQTVSRTLMRFDLIDLRLFLKVAETSSITHGADQSNMALASASARIRGMEQALGVPLLERGSRGVKLTPAGRALVHHAHVVLQQLERMLGELGTYARGLKGHVRLLSNTIAVTEFLPVKLASFLADHPNVDIDLEERPSHEIVRAVTDGFADVGIVVDMVDLAELEVFPFATDRLVLIMPSKHPLRRHRRIEFRKALDQEFVGLSSANALQTFLSGQAAKIGQPLKLRVRLSGFEAICRMVEHGVGVAVIPETAIPRDRRSALGTVHLTDAWAVRKLVICVRRLDELTEHAKRLVKHLQSSPRPPTPNTL